MTLRPAPAIAVLAAGASSRMRGADKLLERIDGTPLVLRAARAACAAAAEVVVVLPAEDAARRAWLSDLPVRVVDVAERAMSASIRAAVGACRADAVMLHLADMPEIGADDLHALCEAWRRGAAQALRAAAGDGTPGHPVVFARALFPRLSALRGDVGARDVLRDAATDAVRLPGHRALVDLDTPEAWAAWRAARGNG